MWDQWDIKYALNIGHLSNEDTACSPTHIELCTNHQGHLSIQDSHLGPNSVFYREVPLYMYVYTQGYVHIRAVCLVQCLYR